MLCNSPSDLQDSGQASAHVPDCSASGMAATLRCPLPRTAAVKGLLFFLNQNSYVPRQKKIKEIAIYKFKNTAVTFRKLRELLGHSAFMLGSLKADLWPPFPCNLAHVTSSYWNRYASHLPFPLRVNSVPLQINHRRIQLREKSVFSRISLK